MMQHALCSGKSHNPAQVLNAVIMDMNMCMEHTRVHQSRSKIPLQYMAVHFTASSCVFEPIPMNILPETLGNLRTSLPRLKVTHHCLAYYLAGNSEKLSHTKWTGTSSFPGHGSQLWGKGLGFPACMHPLHCLGCTQYIAGHHADTGC